MKLHFKARHLWLFLIIVCLFVLLAHPEAWLLIGLGIICMLAMYYWHKHMDDKFDDMWRDIDNIDKHLGL
jgi:hypothetical protein